MAVNPRTFSTPYLSSESSGCINNPLFVHEWYMTVFTHKLTCVYMYEYVKVVKCISPLCHNSFLSKNQLTVLPPNVFKLTVFTTLDLSYNNFTYPPPALSNTNQIATL